jgi:hypothetical protein
VVTGLIVGMKLGARRRARRMPRTSRELRYGLWP